MEEDEKHGWTSALISVGLWNFKDFWPRINILEGKKS
jgi:hypothetical protein